ncbi:MAG: hypothetical protein H0Z33_02555 [Bacillaceae bacterium]|nr:hypothetical protein [Bacillaceae bacterium]
MDKEVIQVRDIPPHIMALMMQEHHPSWVSLTSPYRSGMQKRECSYRHPDLSSFIHLEDV